MLTRCKSVVSALCVIALTHASPITTTHLHKRYDYPNPEPCTGNCTWIHDPSLIKKDGLWYRFSTSGNIAIATAPAITGPWEYRGALLDKGTSIFVADGQDIWAPDVTLIGDTYYAYYAVSRMGLQNSTIGVATSTSLLPGSWTDHGSISLPHSADYNLIDPNVLQDAGGQIYFTFGSYWNDIFQTSFSSPPLASAAQGVEVMNVVNNRTERVTVVEGSFQFKHPSNGFYYIFFSVGACCNTPPNLAPAGDEYRIMVCRSQSATGPFTDDKGRSCVAENGGSLVLASHGNVYAPGGQGVVYDESVGRVVLYYHYVRPSVGYSAEQFFFGYNYLDFGSGWPVVV
ncbi:glycosyl hydrolase [Lophiotrema nucula]|uniref:Arabinan endo-1,5-alpha-L-arabinosidase n=1 Tax=Lophiotrema nucula TaxID=690887 RepID=A0A6A5YTR2_9PLEO|nr:glycosyl hydrolase [Lophiotrema nucula]